MYEKGNWCPVCQRSADVYGDHQVGCGRNSDRIYIHDTIRDALFSVAQTAAIAPRKVVPSLNLGTSSWPADVYLPVWKRLQPAALDISVISTMQQRTIVGASNSRGYVLRLGEEIRMKVHAEPCQSKGLLFVHLILETIGGWNDQAVITISHIGRFLGQKLGSSQSEAIV